MRTAVAIAGAGQPDAELAALAERAGRAVAAGGAVVVCGGMGGVMEAVCRGARDAGGLTIGLLPGRDRADANPYVDIGIPTGMGEGRNVLVARAGDALLAIGGGFGTLSEVALALKIGTPVVGLRTWDIDGLAAAADPEEAAGLALQLAGAHSPGSTGEPGSW